MLWGIYSAIYGEVSLSVEKCVEMKGDYVEKQQSCSISVTLKSWSGWKLLDPTTYLLSCNPHALGLKPCAFFSFSKTQVAAEGEVI